MIAIWQLMPRWVWYGIAGVLAAVALLAWLNAREREAVEQDRLKAKAEVLERARDADTRSVGETRAVQDEVERQNDKAREAAAGSDDPLKSYFDSLRKQRASRDGSSAD